MTLSVTIKSALIKLNSLAKKNTQRLIKKPKAVYPFSRG